MIKIGLTGSIGMGKSTTSKLFLKQGVPVYDADASVHKLYKKGQEGSKHIQKIFPKAITAEGSVNRDLLSKEVLGNKEKLKKLESIIHPLLIESRKLFFKKNKNSKLCVLDIPLLFETGGEGSVDFTVVVSTSYEIQRKRVLARKNMTEEKFEKILSVQIPSEEKCKKADFIIDTSIDIDDAEKQVKDIIMSLGF